jgi:hypothetical protein
VFHKVPPGLARVALLPPGVKGQTARGAPAAIAAISSVRATSVRSIRTRILVGVNWPAVFMVGLLAVAFYGTVFLRGWLFKRYQAGKISGRRAGWLYAAVAGGPYLALFAYLVIRSPGSIWLALLLGFVVFGVQIVPVIAIFRYPEDERRKREP